MNAVPLRHVGLVMVAGLMCLACVTALAMLDAPAEALAPRYQFDTPVPGDTPIPSDTTQPPSGTREPKEKDPPPTASPWKFQLDTCARVVRPTGLDLNNEPGFDASFVETVGPEYQVAVLKGPERRNGLWWWQFRAPDGRVGWGVADYAEPSAGPCVAAPLPPSPAPAPKPVVAPSPTAKVPSASVLPITGVGGGWLIPGPPQSRPAVLLQPDPGLAG